jgi:hypothetical protein
MSTSMLSIFSQDIKRDAPAQAVSPFRVKNYPSSDASDNWQLAHFRGLSNYELVTRQYLPLGVEFENAIALRPSNPRFIRTTRNPVLMPRAGHPGFTMRLQPSVAGFQISVMGCKPVIVSVLNSAGDCIAHGQTEGFDLSKLPTDVPLPEQVLAFDVKAAAEVWVSSRSPFTLTHFGVRRSQRRLPLRYRFANR